MDQHEGRLRTIPVSNNRSISGFSKSTGVVAVRSCEECPPLKFDSAHRPMACHPCRRTSVSEVAELDEERASGFPLEVFAPVRWAHCRSKLGVRMSPQ
eukprot:3980546-Pyramimonas_sp.AAC.2